MQMPEMDGSTTFAALREISQRVPIYICSGYSRGEAVDALLAAGAAGFFAKPLRLKTLRDCVHKAAMSL